VEKRAQIAARKIHETYSIKYPINLIQLIKDLNYTNFNIELFEKSDLPKNICGMVTFINDGYEIIIVNKHQLKGRKRFTVAHEIGHIVLGHCKKNIPLFDTETTININITMMWQERQANIFATELLMPIREFKNIYFNQHIISPENIADYFQVSKQAARIRITEINPIVNSHN